MGNPKDDIFKGRIGLRLFAENFHGLTAELVQWRFDPEIRLMEKSRDKGRILSFVKGLRLSARIIYLLRPILSSQNLEVSWGHLIDDNGVSCSPECDIIIHRPGYFHEWNGSQNPVMNFKFIESRNAVAVISCKSYTTSIDKDYCKDFIRYNLNKIYLLAECCPQEAIERLKKQALMSGYKGFYYLYAIDNKSETFKTDENIYIDLLKEVKSLASS